MNNGLSQEQVVECETVFPDSFGQDGDGSGAFDDPSMESTYFGVEQKEETIDIMADIEVRKSSRKRPGKKGSAESKRLKRVI